MRLQGVSRERDEAFQEIEFGKVVVSSNENGRWVGIIDMFTVFK